MVRGFAATIAVPTDHAMRYGHIVIMTNRAGIPPDHKQTLAWLVAAALMLLPVVATAQPAEPDPTTRAALEKRRDAEASLAAAMGRIGTDRTDVPALVDAGRASLVLDNPQAALGFLTRANQLRADDPAVAALTGAAMVQMERPAEAMELFARAAKLGAPERLYLSDRGLANDLLGRQAAAQRDYEAALTQTNDAETVRRYALSLGISGQVDRAVTVLTPQLRLQDRAAWRTRAMVYAVAGRQAEALEIVKATMPGPMAANITPFLSRLASLTPAQQAAAAHFGALPGGLKPGISQPGARPINPPRPVARPVPPPVTIAANPPPARRVGIPADMSATAAPRQTRAPEASAGLAAVMASLRVPETELKATAGALDLAALEAFKSEQRRTAAAAAETRKREVAVAREKAEDTAKAKAEADKKKAEADKKKIHPARNWVQVATGAGVSALASDFRRLAKKYPTEYKGQKAATAEWGRTSRLLVGPFPNAKAASTWAAAYKKAGGDGFVWSSDAGEVVAPAR